MYAIEVLLRLFIFLFITIECASLKYAYRQRFHFIIYCHPLSYGQVCVTALRLQSTTLAIRYRSFYYN